MDAVEATALSACDVSTQMKRIQKLTLGFALLLAATTQAIAQNYPSRPVTLVVPYSTGTGADVLARLVKASV